MSPYITIYLTTVIHGKLIRGASPFPPDEAWSCWPCRGPGRGQGQTDPEQTEIHIGLIIVLYAGKQW